MFGASVKIILNILKSNKDRSVQ